jgi:hypothetical protein
VILATPGQRHEVTQLQALLGAGAVKGSQPDGRPGRVGCASGPASWLPTRAIRSPAPGGWCAVVACRGDPDQVDQRRQPGFDRAARSRPEPGRAQRWPAQAVPPGGHQVRQVGCNYLAWVTLAAAVIWLPPFAERPYSGSSRSIWSESSSALDAHMRKWRAVAPKTTALSDRLQPAYQKVLERNPGGGVGSGQRCS